MTEYKTYFPIVGGPGTIEHPFAKELAGLIIYSQDQRRENVIKDPTLMQLAHYRVIDMIENNYFGHIDKNGYGPNYHARRLGFALPSWYDDSNGANNIESAAAGQRTAIDVFDALMSSPGHRAHIMGENTFYVRQKCYGIGYAFQDGSQYGHYWCVIFAEKS